MWLLKCQYGLKQAGGEWHILPFNWLVEDMGLEQCKPRDPETRFWGMSLRRVSQRV